MENLGENEKRQIAAAEGWLGLGDWEQADVELNEIPAELRGHPAVLQVRWYILGAQGTWVAAGQVARAICTALPMNPFGWVCLAQAAHRLRYTREARNLLLAVVDEFPQDYSIRYDLACYACQLGRMGEAWCWLEKAMALPHSHRLDRMALGDPNLHPLWKAMMAKTVN
jgi:hypothetical protein